MLVQLVNKQKTRVMDSYEWRAENGHICEVHDAALLGEMFTHPAYKGQFCVSAQEPLVAITGSHKAVELLVIYGEVVSVEQLAALSKDETERLAAVLLETKRTVNGWVSQAKKLVSEDSSETAGIVTEIDEETAVSEPNE